MSILGTEPMDRRSDGRRIDRLVASCERVWSRMWPIAALVLAIVVAACGNGNGGGSGY